MCREETSLPCSSCDLKRKKICDLTGRKSLLSLIRDFIDFRTFCNGHWPWKIGCATSDSDIHTNIHTYIYNIEYSCRVTRICMIIDLNDGLI